MRAARHNMRRPDDDEHYEAHLMNEGVGHVDDTDCWCEPHYYWIKAKDGTPMLVVEHEDDGVSHAATLLKRLDEHDWISVLMNTLN